MAASEGFLIARTQPLPIAKCDTSTTSLLILFYLIQTLSNLLLVLPLPCWSILILCQLLSAPVRCLSTAV